MESGASTASSLAGSATHDSTLVWELLHRASDAVCESEEPENLSPRQLVDWLFESHWDAVAVDRRRDELRPKLEQFVARLIERYTPIQ